MYTKHIYEVEGGYGFDIIKDGSVAVHQEFMPDVSGNIRMTIEEANQWADTIIERMVD